MNKHRILDETGIAPEYRRAFVTFFPHRIRRSLVAIRSKQRFVHYTSAAVAESILTNREVWMRQATVMNDFQEIEHGFHCLGQVWSGPIGQALQSLVEGLYAGSSKIIQTQFDLRLKQWRHHTFLTCMSDVPEEALIGLEPSSLIERIIIGPSSYPPGCAGCLL